MQQVTDKLTSKLSELLLKSNALQTFIATFDAYATIKDMSDFLQIPYPTVQGWVAKGQIPCTKVAGSDPKIYLSDLKAFVAEHSKEVSHA